MRDEVRLTMPADPEYLRVARVTAMGIASRVGFTFDDIEDLRIAIDELCFALIGTKGRSGRIELRYRMVAGGIEVEGHGEFDEEIPLAGLTDLSELILGAVVDSHELTTDAATPSFRMVKRRGED